MDAYRLVQCFQNWSVILSMRVILALKEGFAAYPPGFFDFDLPSSRQFGVRMLISESVPGMTPNGRSLSRSAAWEKTVRISDTDIRWPLTLWSIALFADLTRASTAPWYHGLSAGPSLHSNQLKLPLGQYNLGQYCARPSSAPRWLPRAVSQGLSTQSKANLSNRREPWEGKQKGLCVISKHHLEVYCTTTKVSEYDAPCLSCGLLLHFSTNWVRSKQIKHYWCEWRCWFQPSWWHLSHDLAHTFHNDQLAQLTFLTHLFTQFGSMRCPKPCSKASHCCISTAMTTIPVPISHNELSEWVIIWKQYLGLILWNQEPIPSNSHHLL